MTDGEIVHCGPLRIDPEFSILCGPGGRTRVSADASRLLAAMASEPGRTFTTAELFALCTRKPDSKVSAEVVVRARIGTCRSALRRVDAGDLLQADHKVGYALVLPRAGRRLSQAQDQILQMLLDTHPDRAIVFSFKMAEFVPNPRELAARYALTRPPTGSDSTRSRAR